jgi:hypothetical protein
MHHAPPAAIAHARRAALVPVTIVPCSIVLVADSARSRRDASHGVRPVFVMLVMSIAREPESDGQWRRSRAQRSYRANVARSSKKVRVHANPALAWRKRRRHAIGPVGCRRERRMKDGNARLRSTRKRP